MTNTLYRMNYAQGTESDLAFTVHPSSFYLGNVRAAHHGSGAPLGKARPAPAWLALIPVVPALFFVWALFRAVQKMDELQRRICLESVFFAFILTLVLAFVMGGLIRRGFTTLDLTLWELQ